MNERILTDLREIKADIQARIKEAIRDGNHRHQRLLEKLYKEVFFIITLYTRFDNRWKMAQKRVEEERAESVIPHAVRLKASGLFTSSGSRHPDGRWHIIAGDRSVTYSVQKGMPKKISTNIGRRLPNLFGEITRYLGIYRPGTSQAEILLQQKPQNLPPEKKKRRES